MVHCICLLKFEWKITQFYGLCLLEWCKRKCPEVRSSGQVSRRGESWIGEPTQDQGQVQGRIVAGSGRHTSDTEHNHEQFTQWWLEQDWLVQIYLPPYWIGPEGGPRWYRPLLWLQPMGSARWDRFNPMKLWTHLVCGSYLSVVTGGDWTELSIPDLYW